MSAEGGKTGWPKARKWARRRGTRGSRWSVHRARPESLEARRWTGAMPPPPAPLPTHATFGCRYGPVVVTTSGHRCRRHGSVTSTSGGVTLASVSVTEASRRRHGTSRRRPASVAVPSGGAPRSGGAANRIMRVASLHRRPEAITGS